MSKSVSPSVKSKIVRLALVSLAVLSILAEVALAFVWWEFKFNANQNFEVVDLNGKEKVRPGDELNYLLRFGDNGLVNINDLEIEISIPSGTEVIAVRYDKDYEVHGDKVVFRVGSPRRGGDEEAGLTIEVNNPLDRGTIIAPLNVKYRFKKINRQYLVLKDSGISREVESSPKFDQSVVSSFDENGGEVNVGDLIRYEVIIKNTGDMNARNVHIEKFVPANTILQQAKLTTRSGSFNLNSFSSANIEKISVGEEATLDVEVRVRESLADRTEIVFSPILLNGSDEVELTEIKRIVRVYPKFENFAITLIDVDGGATAQGDSLQVLVHIENDGDTAATDLKFEIDIPAKSSLNIEEAASDTRYEVDGSKLVWNIGELGVNEKSDLEFYVNVNNGIGYGETISTNGLISCNELEDINVTSNAIKTISPFTFTIVGLGDSQMARTSWLSRLDAMLEATFPLGEFNVVNSGRSGEYTVRAYDRLGETVYPYKPRFVIVGFGTNDSLTNPERTFNVPPDAFRYYLSRIVYDIKVKTGATVLVLSTGVLDENLRNWHYNDDMEMYNQIAAEVAAQNGCIFVDVFHQMISDPTKYVDPDGLHFNKEANRVVSDSVFNALVSRLDAYGYPK